eukprot:CAMPEP_0206252042 /NCGR_PEP_ID=MMETSP0047_2-20121206/22358_1 /ASSEMBLY_ACC=CAM_ASM_000192 /TAXON_ID=195065 /ORGANISM="Chroomonas mesostigmatica_cf, Strain CCMP1168" /LENGTH=75 /DNA_ID=CAMNT_0053678059 /DNA_START=91 /DNA_END=315 /DNA_ORIENTATION=-
MGKHIPDCTQLQRPTAVGVPPREQRARAREAVEDHGGWVCEALEGRVDGDPVPCAQLTARAREHAVQLRRVEAIP